MVVRSSAMYLNLCIFVSSVVWVLWLTSLVVALVLASSVATVIAVAVVPSVATVIAVTAVPSVATVVAVASVSSVTTVSSIATVVAVASVVMLLAVLFGRMVVRVIRHIFGRLCRLVVVLSSVATVALVAFVFVLLLLVEAGKAVLSNNILVALGVLNLALLLLAFFVKQLVYLLAAFVQRLNFSYTVGSECYQIGCEVRVARILHGLRKDIGLEVVECSVLGFQWNIAWRNLFLGFNVAVLLKVEAALQFRTLAGKFLRVQRNFLVAGCRSRYRHEIAHPA